MPKAVQSRPRAIHGPHEGYVEPVVKGFEALAAALEEPLGPVSFQASRGQPQAVRRPLDHPAQRRLSPRGSLVQALRTLLNQCPRIAHGRAGEHFHQLTPGMAQALAKGRAGVAG